MGSFADLAIVGARVRTLDPKRPRATAVAVRDGMILAVGDDAEVREHCDANSEIVDARGAAVVPGLVDAHQHPFMGAEASQGVDLNGLATLEEVRRALAKERARCGEGAWIQGFGLDYDVFEGTGMHGRLIQDAVGGNPALITCFDFHTFLATPAALALAGITGPREFEVNAEVVCRDGAPTGELREAPAASLVQSVIPEPDDEERYRWYVDALGRQNAVGITGIHMMDGTLETHETLRRMEAEGNLTARIVAPFWIKPETSVEEMRELAALGDERGRTWRGAWRSSLSTGSSTPGRPGWTSPMLWAPTRSPSGRTPRATPKPSPCSRGPASGSQPTRSGTARCATPSTPIAPPAQHPEFVTASST